MAAIAALAVGGLLAYKYVFAKSDADQIKALVQNVTADQNNADGPGLLTLLCTTTRGRNPATSEMLRNDVNEYGTVATSVTDIRVTGDRATAQVTTTRSKQAGESDTETQSFAKENGSWKVCPAAK
jgi:hypothetical protein